MHAALPVLQAISPSNSSPCPSAQAGADLHFSGPANQRRGRADTLSKIVFQHLARTRPISIDQLLEAAAASETAAASAAAAAGPGLGDRMGSGDSASLLAGGSLTAGVGGGAMSVASEAGGGGGSSMALEAGETDGIEVDS
jgi:snurportin-1